MKIETIQSFVSLLVTLIGAISTVFGLFRKDYPTPTRPETEGGPQRPASPQVLANDPQDLAELAFSLILAATFSLLLTHSLVISGRQVDHLATSVAGLLITTSVTAILLFAWRKVRLEFAVAAFSIITLVSLILAPAGPLAASAVTGEQGIPPLIPSLILVTIASCFLFYLFGTPLKRLPSRRSRFILVLVLISISSLAAIASGLSLRRNFLPPDTAAFLRSDEALAIHNYLNDPKTKVEVKRTFYSLASEHALLPYYLRSSSQIYEQLAEVKARLASSGRPQASTPPPAPTEENELYDLSEPEYQSDSAIGSSTALLRYDILTSLSSMDSLPDPYRYMLNRLSWIHPIGSRAGAKVPIVLPGSTAEERLKETSQYRIFRSLIQQPGIRNFYSRIFTYPETVALHLDAFEDPQRRLLDRLGILGTSEVRKYEQLTTAVLPPLSAHSANTVLKRQLSLPAEEEAAIVIHHYRQLAFAHTDTNAYKDLSIEFDRVDKRIRDAFVYYLADVEPKDRASNWQIISQLGLTEVPTATYDSAIDVGRLASRLPIRLDEIKAEDENKPIDAVETLALAITKRVVEVAQSDRPTASRILSDLQSLLRQQAPTDHFSGIDLFRPEVLSLVRKMRENLTEEQVEEFLNIAADPLGNVLSELARRHPELQSGSIEEFGKALESFKELDSKAKEALLAVVASDLYRVEADSVAWLILLKAQLFGFGADIFLAALACYPFFLLCIFASAFAGRKMIQRDIIRRLIVRESQAESKLSDTFGVSLELRGRAGTLQRIERLSRRGWNTIALVGRRGVGKSRLLHELLNSSPEGRSRIEVWITAPARYREESFIASCLETVALNAEKQIATHLGAAPHAVRQLVAQIKPLNIGFFLTFICLFSILILNSHATGSEPLLLGLAFGPSYFVALSSVLALFFYLSRIQPVDLSMWLQTHSASPQTQLMYQESLEAIRFVRRGSDLNNSWRSETPPPYRKALLWIIGIFAFPLSLITIFGPDFPSVVFSLILLLSWFQVYRKKFHPERQGERSLLSLTNSYRQFVHSLVKRVRSGALGEEDPEAPGVVICIDELDKIIDLEEIRQFIRKIKGVFEVPGVFYYISLAEDAFAALYLGSTEGKEELDSSFDHILRIPSLAAEDGMEIAIQYLKKIRVEVYHDRLPRTIAAAAFGIPRDILRFCDEVAADDSGELAQDPGHFVHERRKLLAQLSYELQRLVGSEFRAFRREGPEAAATAKASLAKIKPKLQGVKPATASGDAYPESTTTDERSQVFLSVWILALLEEITTCEDEEAWLEWSDRIRSLGSRIPVFPAIDLAEQLEELEKTIATAWPETR